jgi:hypothetical protein
VQTDSESADTVAVEESVSPACRDSDPEMAVYPHKGTSSGRCWRGSSAASPSCSARNLPVVVVIDGHRPPLIDCVDDIGFSFEGKPK